MAKYRNPEQIEEIVRRRLRGEPISLVSADMGLSSAYIYSLLSKLPKIRSECPKKSKPTDKFLPEEEFRIVIDYLEHYPSQKRVAELGKDRTDEIVMQAVAEMHGLSVEQVSDTLFYVSMLHPKVTRFPLYSRIEKWKNDNLITMRELSELVGTTPQSISKILNGLEHMPLEIAQRIQAKSGLSLYEIYMDLLEPEKEFQIAEKRAK